MTKDRLENYIKDHREEFDVIEPSADLWSGISGAGFNVEQPVLESGKRNIKQISIKWISRIAAAVLIFLASYYVHDYRNDNDQIANNDNSSLENSSLYNTLIEAEYYYTARIGAEKDKLYALTVGNSPIRDEIQDELEELDREFRALKEDLKDNVDNEDIIAAMIQNYRLKLSILQDMMMQLQEDKKEKKSDNETKRIHI